MRALKSILLLAAAALLLSACQVNIVVDLDVAADGSGTVTVAAVFDEEAAAFGDVERRLRLADLEAAGWQVEGPTLSDRDGSITVAATKAVPSPTEWQQVLDEIAGAGVFTDFELVRGQQVGELSQSLRVNVDVSDGWELFTDEDTTAALGGEPFGLPIDQLTDGRAIDEVIGLTLVASVSSDDGGQPTVLTFAPRFDDPDQIKIEAISTAEDQNALLLRWVGFAALGLFVLSAVLAVVGYVLQARSARIRASRPEPLTSRIPGEAPTPSRGRVAAANPIKGPVVRLIIVEPLSVLYQQGEPDDVYVLPFVRHNGGEARADHIMDCYAKVLVGRMTTAEFWPECGVSGAPDQIDPIFIKMRWLRYGAADFLDEMQKRRIPVAAVTNDAVEWSHGARDRDRLSEVWPWVVSAEVGARKPNPGMFEILRRETGVAYEHCLYIDTDLENLDLARSLGMKTTLFDTGDLELPAVVEHHRIKDLAELS